MNHPLLATSILLAPALLACASTAPDTAEVDPVTLLFVQNAESMSYDETAGQLTLDGVSPVVTYFSDRPRRIAGHVLLPTFIGVWDEGGDSFEADPPNAEVSILGGDELGSAVVELTNPKMGTDRLTYDVKVVGGTLPATGGVSSLFIDGLFRPGPVRGAAAGAVVGSISGHAGRGAAIGAGVGLIRRRTAVVAASAYDQGRADQAADETRVVNVPNANGSFTPVTLHLVANGWQGPKGEIYPTLPDAKQLEGLYGVK
jgi:hypothetical protein